VHLTSALHPLNIISLAILSTQCNLSSNYQISSHPMFIHEFTIFSSFSFIYPAIYELTSSRFLIPNCDYWLHISNISCYPSPRIYHIVLLFFLRFTSYLLITTCHLLFICFIIILTIIIIINLTLLFLSPTSPLIHLYLSQHSHIQSPLLLTSH
jgi:hypothetical protein